MYDLFLFEFKKIACKRFNIIVVLCSVLLTILLFWLPIKQYVVFSEDGNSVRGKEAIAVNKKALNKYAGELADERIRQDIGEYQSLFLNPNNLSKDNENKSLNEEAIYKYVQPYFDYWKLIDYVYIEPYMEDFSLTELSKISIDNKIDFYGTKDKKIKKLLNLSYEDIHYSEKEKKFWMNQAEEISQPFHFAYHAGWKMFFSCLELFAIPLLAICICITTVFSGEYQLQTDSLILVTKYGKSKLLGAKLIAAFSFTMIIFALHILLATVILFSGFGTDGALLPLQILNATIPYKFTMFQGYLICILTAFLVMFGMVSVTLLMSSKMKSPLPTVAVIIFLIFSTMFVGYSETNGVWNRIIILMPQRALTSVWPDDFSCYFSWNIFGKVFDVVTVRMIVYVVLTIICIPLTVYFFRRHQVK